MEMYGGGIEEEGRGGERQKGGGGETRKSKCCFGKGYPPPSQKVKGHNTVHVRMSST